MSKQQQVSGTSSLIRVPLSALVKSERNVRKSDGGDISGLAASIHANGLIHPLVVEEHGKKYAVVAGWRRTMAMRQLVASKALSKDHEVECRLVADAGSALEVSAAENELREAMHAADQFEAFRAMLDAGSTTEDVAARFGVTAAVVLQRLKLASVAPALIEKFRGGELNLGQMMALAITDDHEAQQRVWSAAKKQGGWMTEPRELRAKLTQGEVRASADQRVRYVGLEAFERAGGAVRRDLFSDSGDCYIADVALLDRLTNEKLEKAAGKVRREGFAWVEPRQTVDYSELHRFTRAKNLRRAHTPTERDELAALATEDEQLEGELERLYETEPEEGTEARARLEVVEARRAAIADRRRLINDGCTLGVDDIKAHTGALVYIENGATKIERGLIRPEDLKAVKRELGYAQNSDAEGAGDDKGAKKEKGEFSEALTRRLTTHRTMAARALLAESPNVALAALAHALIVREFFEGCSSDSPLHVAARDEAKIVRGDAATSGSQAAKVLAEKRDHLAGLLPQEEAGLLAWTLAQPMDVLLAFVAFCLSGSLDLIQGRRADTTEHGCAVATTDVLTNALGLDMADWWSADAESYFTSVSKAKIVEAVSEARGESAGEPVAAMKKGEAASAAERAIAGTRWLPSLLRKR